MLITETNVTVMVSDMDRAVNFYTMLGLEVRNRWENHYAQMETQNIIIGLHPADGEVKPSSQVSIGFMIEDIKEAETLLGVMKVKFSKDDGKSGIYINFTDPDGTNLYFSQPKWR